ncbi:MAG: Membrane protein involved in the export of O-antigen and teichoic acid [Parcubacteria group bacterium GW2011_GWC1_41_7]|nr:MAG: Membrane protein involved in the export of O-antigen and teichoic acid [Parcubacteria group bacterium GW2011_GWC1_41_7]
MLKFFTKNISATQTLAKNSFWIVFGRVSAGVLRAILVVFSARLMGVENFGSFTLAMNFVLIFSFLPEFGFTAILTRELVKKEIDPQKVFSTIFLITLLFSGATLLLVLALSPFLLKDALALSVVPILAIMMIFDVLREFAYAVFRSEEKMEKQGLLHFATNALLFGLGMWVLLTRPDVISFSYVYLLAIAIGTVAGMALIKSYFKKFSFTFDKKLVIHFFKSSWPIALANFIFFLLLYIDSVILGWFHTRLYVGLYNSTVKLNEFLIFIPQALALAIFPMMSRNINNPPEFAKNVRLGMKASALFVFPIIAGVYALAYPIVMTIFGSSYIAAVPALRIIIFSMLGVFPFSLLTNALIALDKRKELLIFDFALLAFNIIGNILLIPHFDFYAAAYTTTATNLLGFLCALFIVKKYIPESFTIFYAKPIIASVIMIATLLPFLHMNLIFLGVLGVVVYLVSLYILKEEFTLRVLKKISHR